MQGKGRFVFLGISSFQGKKDPNKTFFSLSLLQGSETFKVMLDDGQQHIFKDAKLYDEFEIDYNASARLDNYTKQAVINLRLQSVTEVETGEITDLSPEISKSEKQSENKKELKAV